MVYCHKSGHLIAFQITMSTKHDNNFNFLRLFFALLVLLSHSPELIYGNRSRELLTMAFGTISFGEFAVDGFFLLSGYLIVQSWTRKPDAWTFLKSRLLRIVPAFVVASLICAFIIGPIGSDSHAYFAAFSPIAFLSGIALLQSPILPPSFAGTHYPVTNGSMWTISLEFTCYLLVLLLGLAGATRRAAWVSITVTIFAGLLLTKLGFRVPDLGAVLAWQDQFIRLASFFLTGGCFFLFKDRIVFTGRVALAAAVAIIACLFSWRGAEFGLAIFGGYLLFFVALQPVTLLRHFKTGMPDVSYGVYLYGWPVQKLTLWYVPSMSPWVLFAVSAILSIALGAASWFLIEKPFTNLKRASRECAQPYSAAGAASISSSLKKRECGSPSAPV